MGAKEEKKVHPWGLARDCGRGAGKDRVGTTVFVACGHHYKVPQTRWLKHQKFSVKILEARSARSRFWQGLWLAPSLAFHVPARGWPAIFGIPWLWMWDSNLCH